ncbi:MAG: hypothetical protein M3Z36_14775 [Acidobacteriota bacterium]|nr:hypothetical protein [Acidobacteriota bacterium]
MREPGTTRAPYGFGGENVNRRLKKFEKTGGAFGGAWIFMLGGGGGMKAGKFTVGGKLT